MRYDSLAAKNRAEPALYSEGGPLPYFTGICGIRQGL